MMKKACLILLALSMVFGMVACKTTTTTTTGPTTTPEWLNDLPPADALWGVGADKTRDASQSMDFAELRARSSLARQLNTLAQQMLTDYFLQAGTVEDQATSTLKENVQRQIINMDVSGAQVIKKWQAADGTWWFLAEMKKSDAKTKVASIIGNQEAQFAQFKAQQALQMMEAQIDKNNEKAVVVYE